MFQNVYAFAAKPGESFVGQVLAQNLDGDITYRIAEGGATLFRINATDGRIFYHGPLSKEPRNYELKVTVNGNLNGKSSSLFSLFCSNFGNLWILRELLIEQSNFLILGCGN